MMPADVVRSYLDQHFRIVTWPHIGDSKGPKEKGWPEKIYTLEDYHEGYRVGLLTGVEVAPGQFLHDTDIDWAPGSLVAQKLLPSTEFIFGRASKRISHCFYLTPEAIPSFRYEDIDKTCLIELRGTKVGGDLGLQTMVPPSVWSKDTVREPLIFVKDGLPTLVQVSKLKQDVCLSAIGMLLVRHLGKNGFGHEPRLAWAGFLLRAGIPVEDLIKMGEAISSLTNNLEVVDVRRSVESTLNRLADPKQKIKGGPALAKIIGDKGKAVVARINEWLGRDSDFIRTSDGLIIKDHQENIHRATQLLDTYFSFNEFADRMLVKTPDHPSWKLLDDRTVDDLWLRIDREFKFRPTFMFFEKVITRLAFEAPFHPVRDYLRSLIWDETPRVDTWLATYGGADDSPYHRAVSALVLLAAVRRVQQPGCKFDEMLVLESSQGLDKSSALRALCPNPEWFSSDLPLNIDAKQMIERTLGKWIIEASDLAGKRKADTEQLKATLSRQVDGPARLAYARISVERARQFIIVGTTNSAAYLSDSTGARRFWPVKVQRFDVAGITRDRDQLWAEAASREARGESIRLSARLWDAATEHQEGRREVDAWEEIIEQGLEELVKESASGRKQVTSDAIWSLLGIETGRRDRMSAMRISEIMQRLGYVRWKIKIDGRLVVGYQSERLKLNFEKS